ncbi:E3 ubiquitin-protein ligase TRIM21-like [Seriola lalandi dorsalis]|uniref:E3 ubiquitin-protein ligase TRIM21-like n=1 Tax=Seriola lalandi dorsalis TaxID=1841481 RepID=UPI000C6F6644|nr:E3 ubiquitin-protein ligase TRIM21-like [Seriola lalandi dorsalis]XP_023270615.1 E3 ubiquitin-protein ligase TRIM21-like [Seriola lalandi dorsalis]
MATLREELLNILLDLNEDQFKRFKFYLRDDGIPLADLEKADRPDTVELMINKYRDRGALKVTSEVLQKISRNDLVERLQNFRPKVTETKEPSTTTHPLALAPGNFGEEQSLDPPELAGAVFKDCSFTVSPVKHDEEYERKKAELQYIQQFAVDVTLDTDTAQLALILSDDGPQLYCGDVCQKPPDSFSSGRFYFEVKVKGKTAWTVGVAKDSIYRRGKIPLGPSDGFWTVWLRNGNEYSANDDRPVRLFPNQHPQKVGVFVDYEKGLVTFYDVDSADFLYAFTGCAFTEELYPYVSHCSNDNGINSAPLIICPVNCND